MSTAHVVVTVLAAAMTGFSAASVFLRSKSVVRSMADYGVPQTWLPWLGAAKAAGAAGLLVGLAVPLVGVVAGIALILYFTGAVITVARARWYAHLPFPLVYAAPVVGALALTPGAW
ncbi:MULTISPECIES: DoxX family protein [Streptomyces]|uniref:DoxX family protein n=1 Tax=Streptomyces TaxID=1883 RepID=UPI001E47EE41|nr:MULTISPECIES: DoxX family protein [Streptomyces]UFQ16132.1 DoxX family protein [Streptomyces huasconensis]WCL85736.1 DoxX family protein [Streptomyces sp. JCM 35825]